MKIILSLLLAFIVLELIFTIITLIFPCNDEICLAFSENDIKVNIFTHSFFPRCYRLKIQVENLYTGESVLLDTKKIYAEKNDKSTMFRLSENYCGVIRARVIQAKSCVLTSFFMKKFESTAVASKLFLPKITNDKNQMFNALYQSEKPQGRSQNGEIIGVREYQCGENLRNVHMKLSAKIGKYMVKEQSADDARTIEVRLEKSENPEAAHENAKNVLSQVYEVLSCGDCVAVTYGEFAYLITGEWEIEKAFFELLSQGRRPE